MNVCTIRGCGKRHHAKGLCLTHYQRQRRQGDAHGEIPVGAQVQGGRKVMTVCTRPGCGKPHLARGLCQACYRRDYRRRARG